MDVMLWTIFTFEGVLLLVILSIILADMHLIKKDTACYGKLEEIIDSGFRVSHKYLSNKFIICVDQKNKRWVVLDRKNPSNSKAHRFNEVLEAEILSEEDAIIRGDGSSTAVMKKHKTKHGIRLVLDSLKQPMIYIDFLNANCDIDSVYSMFTAMIAKEASA